MPGVRQTLADDRRRLLDLFARRGYRKVMIVTTRFPPYPPDVTVLRGGIDTNNRDLIHILEGGGINVTIAALDYMKGSGLPDGPGVARIGTYSPYTFESSRARKFLRLLWSETLNPSVLVRLLVLLREERPDAMILQESLQLGLAPHAASRLLGIPLYIRNDWICPARPEEAACGFSKRLRDCSTCIEVKMGQSPGRLEGYATGLFSALIYLLKSWFWQTGAGAIAPSEFMEGLLVGYGVPRERITVVRPSRDIEVYPVTDEPFARLREDSSFKLLFVGRLEKDKGIDLLMEAFEKALGAGAEADLLVAGEGTLRPLVEERVVKCPRVTYLGWLDEAGLSQAYQVSDAVIMPTIVIESHGIVAEEAISYDRLLVGSNRGGLAKIMADYPRSVPLDDLSVEALANVIACLAEKSEP